MKVNFWIGRSFQTRHENVAMEQLAYSIQIATQKLEGNYLHIAFSFFIGAEIDICAIGSGGAVVGELKEWPGIVRGRLNGPWIVTLTDGSTFLAGQRENAFQQCKRVRSSLARLLSNFGEKTKHIRKQPSSLVMEPREWSNKIECGVIQCPNKNSEIASEIEAPWWFLEGMEEWTARAIRKGQKDGIIQEADVAAFFAQLGLERLNFDHIVKTQGPSLIDEEFVATDKPHGQLFFQNDAARKKREAEQEAAINAPTNKHLQIIAGPGAGKTHVLVQRVSHLVNLGTNPNQIAIVTYTNSARIEIQKRLEESLSIKTNGQGKTTDSRPFVGTIHQFCGQIVRANTNLLQLPKRVRILDENAASRIYEFCSAPEKEFEKPYEQLRYDTNYWDGIGENPLVNYHHIWRAFETQLKKYGGASFETIQLWALQLIQQGYLNSITHVFVDEYQDTTGIQVRILKDLAQKGIVITVVGDQAQAIFSFAGSDYKQLGLFPQIFNSCTERRLSANSRSVPEIVELVSNLRPKQDLLGNQFSLMKSGDKPRLIYMESAHSQDDFVLKEIETLIKNEGKRVFSPGEIAVLVREGIPTRLMDKMSRRNIPCQKHGEDRFETRPHILRLISAIETMAELDSENTQLAFFDEVIGASAKTWKKISENLVVNKEWDSSLCTAYESLTGFRKEEVAVYHKCRKELKRISGIQSLAESVYEIQTCILEPMNTIRERKNKKRIEEDVLIVCELAYQYNNALDLTDAIRNGVIATEPDPDAVTIATLHYSKGREWSVVFILDLTNGVLPHRKALDKEEEKRLLHVGASRAKELLYLCAPKRLSRRGNSACEFLDGLKKYCEVSYLSSQ